MPTINSSTVREGVAHGQKELLVEDGQRGQLYRSVTIDMLPDDVLLEIFDLNVDEHRGHMNRWCTLVHVCGRWRQVVFASPRRLNLRILCTPKSPVERMLSIWPPFPIVIQDDREVLQALALDYSNMEAALNHNDRVCEIRIKSIQTSFLETFAATKRPFTALTDLHLEAENRSPIGARHRLQVPDSLLSGSASRLRTLALIGIPFLGLPKLLLSAHDLVVLDLEEIPFSFSGYMSPEEMVKCLSSLTRLKSLNIALQFGSGEYLWIPRRDPPGLKYTVTVLPSLTSLRFGGPSEYLGDFVARIDVPLLYSVCITLFYKQMSNNPSLRHFISRTKAIKEPHRIIMEFHNETFSVTLPARPEAMVDDRDALFKISCTSPSTRQLSSAVLLCNSSFPPLRTVEQLDIFRHSDWEDVMENTQWLELLHPFPSVRELYLNVDVTPYVASVLRVLSREGVVTEVLPVLQNIFTYQRESLGCVSEAFAPFVAARKLQGLPITLYHPDDEMKKWQGVNY